MKQHQFRGTGVALVTPFDKNGKVDFDALERVIEHTIQGGVDYVVSLGTTGEAVTLSSKECRAIVDFTIKIVNGRLPIVVGMFGGNNTAQIVERFNNFNFNHVNGVLSSSPAYNKPTQEGLYQHYMKLESVSPVPIIIYNVPGRTSNNIDPKTTLKLAEASNKFVAIKDASGSMAQGTKLIKERRDDFLILSGDDPTALPLIACGADGVISVISNALPAPFTDMVNAALKGDMKTAQHLHAALSDIHQWLYIDGNPAGIKGALEMMGICSKETRLPLVPISDRNYSKLKKELEKVGKQLNLKVNA